LINAGGPAREAYDVIAQRLDGQGFTRKQIREAARAVMPNATETKIVVTGNMRAWRHVCKMRGSEHADAEIRQFAHEVLRQLKEIAPNIFQDM
jgi:thymidylate synthase (FAD)